MYIMLNDSFWRSLKPAHSKMTISSPSCIRYTRKPALQFIRYGSPPPILNHLLIGCPEQCVCLSNLRQLLQKLSNARLPLPEGIHGITISFYMPHTKAIRVFFLISGFHFYVLFFNSRSESAVRNFTSAAERPIVIACSSEERGFNLP